MVLNIYLDAYSMVSYSNGNASMKFDVLSVMRNAAMQPPSGDLMAATRAIQESLQTMSPLQNNVSSSPAFTFKSGPPSDWLHPVPDSIIEGEYARVDSHNDQDHVQGRAKPSSESGDQFVSGSFTHAGASLDYRLYIPPVSVRNGSLLVMLHGCTQEATDFSTGTAMNTLARNAGYTVLYPNQNSSANTNRCWNWFLPAHQQRAAGEPALLGALTQSICQKQALDSGRVFVAGLSAGGAMALILAEEFPDIFAGVGVHSGLATGLANSTPQALQAMTGGGKPAPLNPATRHRPTLVIHGDQDRTVHPQNAGVIVERCLGQYRQHNSGEKLVYRCHEQAVGHHGAKRHEYRTHGGQIVCRHLQLSSVGHAWSGGDLRGSHTAAGGVSASESLLSFFDECPDLVR